MDFLLKLVDGLYHLSRFWSIKILIIMTIIEQKDYNTVRVYDGSFIEN